MPRYQRYQQMALNWEMFFDDLRHYQGERGLSSRELAQKLQVSASALSLYFGGKRRPNSEVFGFAVLMMEKSLTAYFSPC